MARTLTSLFRKPQRGFTIIELVVVIVVIAILATIIVVSYGQITKNTKLAAIENDLRQAQSALESKKQDTGAYPSLFSEIKVKLTSGSTIEYTYSAAARSYCLKAINGSDSYYILSKGSPTQGTCPTGWDTPVNAPGTPGVATQPSSCPAGFIPVPGVASLGTTGGFCIMKYEAKNVGGVATSQASGTPWVSISLTSAMTTSAAACTGCHNVSEAEWMTVAANVLSVASNWTGGAIGAGSIYSGHNDDSPSGSLAAGADNDGYSGTGQSSGNQRRTLTLPNGQVIWDFSGNVAERTTSTIAANAQPGIAGESSSIFKEWSNGSLQWGNLPASSRPSALSVTLRALNIAFWDSSNGIGKLLSNRGDTNTYMLGFLRSGVWNSGAGAGVLSLFIAWSPDTPYEWIGFRVAK